MAADDVHDLYHYYDEATGPFRNLSDLSPEEAEAVQERLRREGGTFAARRSADYLTVRRELEEVARRLFQAKGGAPARERPHYMTLGACPWLLGWYRCGRELRIPAAAFDPRTVSFTYGDLFPTMRYRDGKPYRGQVYTWNEIRELIHRYGLPQQWNGDGSGGPERYIEAQVWDDRPLRSHRQIS